MKKILLILTISLLCLSTLFANGVKGNTDSDDKIKIVTTIFPEYDWVREILGDEKENVELTLLLDNGTDLHSYQPSFDDIAKISSCDLFIYVGGESDTWVSGVLKEAVNKNMISINLLETLGQSVKEEEIVEGMQQEESDHEEKEYDEHVWLSLRNAEKLVKVIKDSLITIAPEKKNIFSANCNSYIAKLDTLDKEYIEVVNSSKKKTLLFADRFPFRYLVDDYGLGYYAAFAGCSAETEASFETITFLANKVDELGLKSVLTIEKSDDKIAKTIINNTKTKDQKILTLNSMQSVTTKDIEEGESYLSVMEGNLTVLKEALN